MTLSNNCNEALDNLRRLQIIISIAEDEPDTTSENQLKYQETFDKALNHFHDMGYATELIMETIHGRLA